MPISLSTFSASGSDSRYGPMVNEKTRIADLTVGELRELIRATMEEEAARHNPSVAFGMQGLADVFGVSVSQAKRMKASGILDRAISQQGRTIVVDVPKARQLWSGKRS